MPLNNEVSILNIHNIDNDIKDEYTRAMIAGEEKERYATHEYVKNQYFIWNDRKLYKALGAISIGTTFVVDDNIKYVGTLSSELYDLYSQSSIGVKELIGNVEEANASRAYSFGEYIILASTGLLYAVTNNVSYGTLWVEGTNIKHVENFSTIITELDRGVHRTRQSIAYVEPTDKASKSHEIGEEFIFNGILVKATAHIEQQATIILNGNCVASRNITAQLEGEDISYTHDQIFKTGVPLWTLGWESFKYVDLYFSMYNGHSQCIRFMPDYKALSDQSYTFTLGQINFDNSGVFRQVIGAFVINGRYLDQFKLYMNYNGIGSTPSAWTDITNNDRLVLDRVIGFWS